MKIHISSNVYIPYAALDFKAVLSAGPGGQHVNKTASAIQLKFSILESDLPEMWKKKLLALSDKRISKEGVVTIKGKRFRSQHKNKEDVIRRLRLFLLKATVSKKVRIKTKPSKRANEQRLKRKKHHSDLKKNRQKQW
jgi:ribosome-associated protein